jgi:lysophospholipase L1-like esterase
MTPLPFNDPRRFEQCIVDFEQQDRVTPPPRGAIVAIGSSTMRGWHDTIREDLAPLTIIPRGFGGSEMNDAVHYASRIVIPYAPRAILLYEGDNDIAAGHGPDVVLERFHAFVTTVRQALPTVRIYVLSIKPSPSRWALWPAMQAANRLLAIACRRGTDLVYVDVATPMLDSRGEARAELFIADQLHMTRRGYEVWRDAVRPVVIQGEAAFEAPL